MTIDHFKAAIHTGKRTARSLYYASLKLFVLLSLNRKLYNNGISRRVAFDIAKPGSLLVSNQRQETFVVAASDKVIGKLAYIHNRPFDFEKVEMVLKLLGNHKKILLVDVGANIGTICIPAVKRGMFQQAIAIEPEPGNYSLLMANIFINRLSDKITTHNVALGQKDNESLVFELSDFNHGDHRIRTSNNVAMQNEDKRNTISVKCETFDKIVGQITPDEALIWIDTQGYEGFIFAGATNALKRKVPICLEFWPYAMERSGSYLPLKNSLLNAGYTSFYDLEERKPRLIPLSIDELDALYKRLRDKGDNVYTDLLVI